ncbi:hypothetical protein [Catenuloplanes atrovinosus]|uniref:Uncharacterized protein n=1 Tax=Catenuloplanes atrovinosus TaxID=137266 RepID=A0AAE3YTV7_9ACTN|nr:hypothetical protein [Catenuloplanes atrovinosus]MDR7278537.1 hypothetical protein [Catenuloplanes atrovinosus]
MTAEENNGPAREVTPVFIPPLAATPTAGVGFWSSNDVNAARQPTEINSTSGDPGLNTEWDADSLDGAIRWLEEHSKYLGDRLLPAMSDDIGSWLTGPASAQGKSPFGTYPAAQAMAQRHLGHYQTAEQSVRTIAEELLQAAEALKQVKEKYETAERANEMSAQAFEQVFASEVQTGEYGSGSGYPATGTTATPASYPSDGTSSGDSAYGG